MRKEDGGREERRLVYYNLEADLCARWYQLDDASEPENIRLLDDTGHGEVRRNEAKARRSEARGTRRDETRRDETKSSRPRNRIRDSVLAPLPHAITLNESYSPRLQWQRSLYLLLEIIVRRIKRRFLGSFLYPGDLEARAVIHVD